MQEEKQNIGALRRLPLPVVVAAVLLVGGGAAAYWLFSQRGYTPGAKLAADFLPANTSIALSISTDADQWQQLRTFGTKDSKQLFDNNLVQLRDRFLSANGYDYDRDIRPWVGGDITLAFLPPPSLDPNEPSTSPDGIIKNPVGQSVVMVLPIGNRAKAAEILSLAKPLPNTEWVERTYNNITIKESNGIGPQNYAVADFKGRFLVIANSSMAMNRTIDAYNSGDSLATVTGFNEAWNTIGSTSNFARFYVNLPIAGAVTAMSIQGEVSPQNLTAGQHQAIVATMNLEAEGIRFQSLSWLKPDSTAKYVVENNATTMVNRLPASSLMVMTGGNLQRLWQNYAQTAQGNPLAPLKPEDLRQGVKTITKLDFDKDLLGWMAGEFSAALIPNPDPKASPFGWGLALMVAASDRRVGEETLKKLNELMAKEYKYKVENRLIGDRPVTEWISENGAITATHGWLDGNFLFFTIGAPVGSTFVPTPTKPLNLSETFTNTVPLEPTPNNGQFFFDLEGFFKNPPNWMQLPPGQKIFLNAIRAIGVTAAIADDRTTRYELFLRLQKVGSPTPLPPPQVSPAPNKE
ncbi:DUF3352 domain-containing protein [[Phormidium] sp. ETS-05]|uniref:DUF3352 domain-containing protein n=1 Tax=[Phormidium] sp. ETS-05 TaxID=222819 RepID=UPI0018EF2826|nr:DUF3352 domain-containing protein [[Phormidium] sp. ETS-05]